MHNTAVRIEPGEEIGLTAMGACPPFRGRVMLYQHLSATDAKIVGITEIQVQTVKQARDIAAAFSRLAEIMVSEGAEDRCGCGAALDSRGVCPYCSDDDDDAGVGPHATVTRYGDGGPVVSIDEDAVRLVLTERGEQALDEGAVCEWCRCDVPWGDVATEYRPRQIICRACAAAAALAAK